MQYVKTLNPKFSRTWGFQAGSFTARLVDGPTLRVPGIGETVEGAARNNPPNVAAERGEELAELRRRGGGECPCCSRREMGGGW